MISGRWLREKYLLRIRQKYTNIIPFKHRWHPDCNNFGGVHQRNILTELQVNPYSGLREVKYVIYTGGQKFGILK